MSAWERPPYAAFQGCFSEQGPHSGTWLWVGMDGGSLISPPLSNLLHFIMRTVVICFCFPPLLLFLRCWHFWVCFFFIEETEKWCEEEGESRNSHLPSSSYSLSERQGRVAVPYTEHGQPAPAVVPPRRGRVTSYTQEVSSGVSCLSVSLVPFQSPSTPWCISFLSQCSVTAVRNHKSSQAGKICFIHSFCINLLL